MITGSRPSPNGDTVIDQDTIWEDEPNLTCGGNLFIGSPLRPITVQFVRCPLIDVFLNVKIGDLSKGFKPVTFILDNSYIRLQIEGELRLDYIDGEGHTIIFRNNWKVGSEYTDQSLFPRGILFLSGNSHALSKVQLEDGTLQNMGDYWGITGEAFRFALMTREPGGPYSQFTQDSYIGRPGHPVRVINPLGGNTPPFSSCGMNLGDSLPIDSCEFQGGMMDIGFTKYIRNVHIVNGCRKIYDPPDNAVVEWCLIELEPGWENPCKDVDFFHKRTLFWHNTFNNNRGPGTDGLGMNAGTGNQSGYARVLYCTWNGGGGPGMSMPYPFDGTLPATAGGVGVEISKCTINGPNKSVFAIRDYGTKTKITFNRIFKSIFGGISVANDLNYPGPHEDGEITDNVIEGFWPYGYGLDDAHYIGLVLWPEGGPMGKGTGIYRAKVLRNRIKDGWRCLHLEKCFDAHVAFNILGDPLAQNTIEGIVVASGDRNILEDNIFFNLRDFEIEIRQAYNTVIRNQRMPVRIKAAPGTQYRVEWIRGLYANQSYTLRVGAQSFSFVTDAEGSGGVDIVHPGDIVQLELIGNAPSPNAPPTPVFVATPPNPVVNIPVTFDATGSFDPDGSIVQYLWDFGDGTTGSGIRVQHAYKREGEYDVFLSVTDNSGWTSWTSSKVSVSAEVPVTPDLVPLMVATAGLFVFAYLILTQR